MATRKKVFSFGLGILVQLFGLVLIAEGSYLSVRFLRGLLMLREIKLVDTGDLYRSASIETAVAVLVAFLGVFLVVVGARMGRKYLCSGCGNRLEKTSRLCPACREPVEG